MKTVRIITDTQTNKPRGYAFLEFEKEKDMKGLSSFFSFFFFLLLNSLSLLLFFFLFFPL